MKTTSTTAAGGVESVGWLRTASATSRGATDGAGAAEIAVTVLHSVHSFCAGGDSPSNNRRFTGGESATRLLFIPGGVGGEESPIILFSRACTSLSTAFLR